MNAEDAPRPLRAREALVDLAAGLTHVMYVLRFDPEPRVEYVSDSVKDYVGYAAADLLTDLHRATRIIDPDDLAAATARITAARPGEVVHFTVRVRTKDGRTVWSHHRCRKELARPRALVVYGAARDETEHISRARELAAREQRLQLILENVSDLVFDVAPEGRLRWVSSSVERVLGWAPHELVGHDPDEYIHPDDLPRLQAARGTRLSEGIASVRRFRIRRADGSYAWVSGVSRELCDDEGEVLGRVWGMHIVDELVRAEQAVGQSEQFFRVLAENSSDMVFRATPDGVIEWISPSSLEVLGFPPEQLVGQGSRDLLHADDLAVFDLTGLRPGEPARHEARSRCADGSYKWLSFVIRPVLDPAGAVIGAVGSARDIQQEVELRDQLIEAERRSRQALDHAPVGTAVADLDRRFLQVNAALCRMLDRDEAWLLAHGVPDVLHDSFDEVDRTMRESVRRGRVISIRGENLLVRADGTPVWVEHSIAMLRDEQGRPQSYVCQFVDISEAKKGREQLSYRATHDALTQLLTRSGLMDGLSQITSHQPRGGGRLAALYIDLDHLKRINDELGHGAGDAVLTEVSARIRRCARKDDLVARVGGDELVVILPNVHSDVDARAVADKVRRALAEPIGVDSQALRATVSIGVAVAEPREAPSAMIERADRALYRAKRGGRNRIAMFDPEVDATGVGGRVRPTDSMPARSDGEGDGDDSGTAAGGGSAPTGIAASDVAISSGTAAGGGVPSTGTSSA